MKFALPVYDINFLKSSSGNIYFKLIVIFSLNFFSYESEEKQLNLLLC